MKKVTRLIFKIILWIIGVFIALDLLIVTLIFIPPIQQFTVLKVSKLLTNMTGGEITVDKIYLTPSLTLKAKNFAIKDHHYNNMIFASKLKGRIHLAKTGNGQVCLSFAELDDGEVIIRKYEGEDTVNIAVWAKGLKKNKEKKSKFKLLFDHIALNDVRFALVLDDKRQYYEDNIIDYGFFELQHIHMDLDNFLVMGPDISCKINVLSFSQYTGFEITDFSGKFRINAQSLTLDSLHFKTPNSIFNGDFAFRYDNFSDYSDFVNIINFDTKVSSAAIAMQDVIYFAPALKGMDNQFVFSGYVGGTVNHLQIKDFFAKFKQQTHIVGDFAIKNVLDFKNSIFDFAIKDAYINFSELAQFNLPKGKKITLPEVVHKLTYAKLHGTYKGSFPKFDADITAQTNMGALTADIQTALKENMLYYTGTMACHDFELGKFINRPEYLNKVSLRTSLEAEARNANQMKDLLASLSLKIRGRIPTMEVCGYSLQNTVFRGNYASQQAHLALRTTDSLAAFTLKGNVNMAKECPVITASLANVNIKLHELSAYYPRRMDSSSAQGFEKFIYKGQQIPDLTLNADSITLSMSGNKFENINGYVGIDNAKLTNGIKSSRLDWFRLTAINKPNASRQFQVHSNAFNVSLKTNYDFADLVNAVKNAAHYYLPDIIDKNNTFALEQEITSSNSEQFIDIDVQCFYTRNFFEMILPKLEMARNTSANIHLEKARNKDAISFSCSQISYTGIGKINNLKADGKRNGSPLLELQLHCDSISIYQKKGNYLTFSDLDLLTRFNRQEVQFNTAWRNPAKISVNEINHFQGQLLKNENQDIHLDIKDAGLFIRESVWELVENKNRVTFNKESILLDQCMLSSNVGKISINGEISRSSSKKECNIVLDNFDVSLLNSLTEKSKMTFGGDMSLIAILSTNANQFMMEGKTFVKEFVFNEERMGDLFLDAQIMEAGGPHFIGGILSSRDGFNVNLSKFTYTDYQSLPNRIIELNGKWLTKENELRVHADIDTLRLGFLSPFLASFSDVVTGNASGHLDFVKKKDSLYFDGKMKIKNAQLGITPLKTVYSITNQEVLFDRKGISFNQVLLRDKFNNTATLSGYVQHNKFNDFKIDLNISTPKILAMNTPRTVDASFFGDGFVSGDVSIKGDTKLLNFTGHNIKTQPGSIITFPLSSASTVSSSQGIYFVQSSANKESAVEKNKLSTELNFDFIFDITKDADVKLELDPIDGILQCKTTGKLHLTYNTLSELLDIDGVLSIVNGKFSMSLKNFFPKDFTIVEGGTISFSGPLTSALLNVSALYQKAISLNSLKNPELKGRTDVNAYLGLSGNLMNPTPSFTFAFPRLNDAEQMKIFNDLDTANQQSGIRQFFSFVFLNTFITPQTNPEDMVQAAGTGIDFAAGILNSLLSEQLGNLNFGVNYINNKEQYKEYSMDVQKNFYNDRIVLKANLGYAENKSMQNSNNVVGGLDFEVELNDAGTWRMNFFFFNDVSDINQSKPQQGGGIGVVYRQAFNNRKDFLESWTRKKKVKKENKQPDDISSNASLNE